MNLNDFERDATVRLQQAFRAACEKHRVSVVYQPNLDIGRGVYRWSGPHVGDHVQPIAPDERAVVLLCEDLEKQVATFAGRRMVLSEGDPRVCLSAPTEPPQLAIWVIHARISDSTPPPSK